MDIPALKSAFKQTGEIALAIAALLLITALMIGFSTGLLYLAEYINTTYGTAWAWVVMITIFSVLFFALGVFIYYQEAKSKPFKPQATSTFRGHKEYSVPTVQTDIPHIPPRPEFIPPRPRKRGEPR